MNRLLFVFFLWLLVFGSVPLLTAQGADVSLPANREKVVSLAEEFLRMRSAPAQIPDPAPNPFVWPVEPEPEGDELASTTVELPKQVTMNLELLTRLAARIPASGTVILGGQPILLLGQKRLKVGDVVTISFEGENYELSIEGITSTSFTVRRGTLTHTRPTFLPASNAPSSRQ